MAEFIRAENLKNGFVLGLILGAILLWGDYIRGPIINFINGLQPSSLTLLGEWWAPIIILLICGLIGFIIDKT